MISISARSSPKRAGIHSIDCRCAPCRDSRDVTERHRSMDGWDAVCLGAGIAAFILIPGRWLLAAATAEIAANLPL